MPTSSYSAWIRNKKRPSQPLQNSLAVCTPNYLILNNLRSVVTHVIIVSKREIPEDVINMISSALDTTKVRSPDEIPPMLIRQINQVISHSVKFFAYHVTQVHFHNKGGISWSPQYSRKGSRANVENYWPVSLLNISPKVFKKCLFYFLYEVLSPQLHENPFDFRSKTSGILQMLSCLDRIYKVLEATITVQVALTEFEKAFGKVDHGIIRER